MQAPSNIRPRVSSACRERVFWQQASCDNVPAVDMWLDRADTLATAQRQSGKSRLPPSAPPHVHARRDAVDNTILHHM